MKWYRYRYDVPKGQFNLQVWQRTRKETNEITHILLPQTLEIICTPILISNLPKLKAEFKLFHFYTFNFFIRPDEFSMILKRRRKIILRIYLFISLIAYSELDSPKLIPVNYNLLEFILFATCNNETAKRTVMTLLIFCYVKAAIWNSFEMELNNDPIINLNLKSAKIDFYIWSPRNDWSVLISLNTTLFFIRTISKGQFVFT